MQVFDMQNTHTRGKEYINCMAYVTVNYTSISINVKCIFH